MATLTTLSACGGGGSSSAPGATVLAQGIVVDDQGVPLTDAQVQVVSDSRVPGTDTQTTTNGDGRFLLTLDAATPAVLRFSKTGHASSVRAVDAASQNEAVAPRVILLPVAATQSFDATEAQVLRVPGSTARVELAAASLRRDDGQPINGAVTVALTPVDPSADPLRMPGLMVDADSGTPIESLGALSVEFTDATGAPLNLASGQTATILTGESDDNTLVLSLAYSGDAGNAASTSAPLATPSSCPCSRSTSWLILPMVAWMLAFAAHT